MNNQFEDLVKQIAHDLAQKQEKYKKEQLIQIINEIILSGDIVDHVTMPELLPNDSSIQFEQKSGICYIPYAKSLKLEIENQQLKERIKQLEAERDFITLYA